MKSLRPTTAILWCFLTLNAVPAVVFLLTTYQENLYGTYDSIAYADARRLYAATACVFVLVVLLTSRLFRGVFSVRARSYTLRLREDADHNNRLAMLGGALVLLYLVLGGYQKLLLLGSSTDAWAFRIIGYNDTNRILTAGLEIARRILLPFALTVHLSKPKVDRTASDKRRIRVIIALQLIGSLMTLDRFPIMLLLFALAYFGLAHVDTSFKRIRVLLTRTTAALMVAGATTYIQYNITRFSPGQAALAGWNFLLHRLITVPSVAAVELSYIYFPAGAEPLYLAYSRLGALVGRRYIGLGQDSSLYVTPCGALGDAWRNFGWPGVLGLGLAMGLVGAWLDGVHGVADTRSRQVVVFGAVSLSFYLIFGVVFSQGVLAQAFFTAVSVNILCSRERVGVATAKHRNGARPLGSRSPSSVRRTFE
jgi:hypothetical protein